MHNLGDYDQVNLVFVQFCTHHHSIVNRLLINLNVLFDPVFESARAAGFAHDTSRCLVDYDGVSVQLSVAHTARDDLVHVAFHGTYERVVVFDIGEDCTHATTDTRLDRELSAVLLLHNNELSLRTVAPFDLDLAVDAPRELFLDSLPARAGQTQLAFVAGVRLEDRTWRGQLDAHLHTSGVTALKTD